MNNAYVYAYSASLAQQDTIDNAVEEIFLTLPALQQLHAGSRILLKPNLLGKHTPEKGVTTHPALVRAVVVALHKKGVVNITLADSPGGRGIQSDIAALYRTTGMQALADELGFVLFNGTDTASLKANGNPVASFEVLAPIAQADLIINLPKAKSHVMTTMTGAVKNLFGTIPGLQKAEMHMRFPQKADFGRMLVSLCEAMPATIHIVDALTVMEGDGPSGGHVRTQNMLLAGQNPYTLDLALCRYMGLEPLQVPYLSEAHKAGLCAAAFDTALLQSSSPALAAPWPNFTPPRSYDGRIDFSQSVPAPLRWAVPLFASWAAPRPVIRSKDCIGCAKCAEICPGKTISIQDKVAHIYYKNCIRCFCCHEVCPAKAIDVKKRKLFRL